MCDIHAYDYNGCYYDTEIVSDLLNLKCVTDVTEEKQVVSVEICLLYTSDAADE